jgi:hypothetical protein
MPKFGDGNGNFHKTKDQLYFMIDCAKCQEIQTVKDYINCPQPSFTDEIYHFYEKKKFFCRK